MCTGMWEVQVQVQIQIQGQVQVQRDAAGNRVNWSSPTIQCNQRSKPRATGKAEKALGRGRKAGQTSHQHWLAPSRECAPPPTPEGTQEKEPSTPQGNEKPGKQVTRIGWHLAETTPPLQHRGAPKRKSQAHRKGQPTGRAQPRQKQESRKSEAGRKGRPRNR